MITRKQVHTVATRSGFRPEPVEKVLRLIDILRRLDRHETTSSAWALKGGTALNLFHLDAPRLSVDVDINFVGVEDVKALPQARGSFERALVSCCERAGCAVKRAPTEHAGGKFRLRFASVLGGTQNLEVDVSYVARLPLLPVERRAMSASILGEDCEAPCVALEELAAGKYLALLSRLAARDFYDAAGLLKIAPDLPERPGFRLAFVCQAAASRTDFRGISNGQGRSAPSSTDSSIRVRSSPASSPRIRPSPNESGGNRCSSGSSSIFGSTGSRQKIRDKRKVSFCQGRSDDDPYLRQGHLSGLLLTLSPELTDRPA